MIAGFREKCAARGFAQKSKACEAGNIQRRKKAQVDEAKPEKRRTTTIVWAATTWILTRRAHLQGLQPFDRPIRYKARKMQRIPAAKAPAKSPRSRLVQRERYNPCRRLMINRNDSLTETLSFAEGVRGIPSFGRFRPPKESTRRMNCTGAAEA